MTALDDDYAKAGFGGSLPWPKRPALVIVDVAMAYLNPAAPLYAAAERIVPVNARLAATFRAAGLRVVFTRVEYAPGGLEGGLFYKRVAALRCFDRDNPLGDFHPDLTPAAGDTVVTKHYPSAFFGTSLASQLTAQRVDGCVVTGLSTSGCVRATALDALCHGFAPIVVEDACADRADSVHAANLFDLRQKYADVMASDAVLARLAG